MRVKSSIAAVLASALALTGLAACGHANDASNGPTATVLNIGMPDGATLPRGR